MIMPTLYDEQLASELAEKFISWPLPESVCADRIATMSGEKHRIGTHLLTYNEARQMMLEVVIAVLHQRPIKDPYNPHIRQCAKNILSEFVYTCPPADFIEDHVANHITWCVRYLAKENEFFRDFFKELVSKGDYVPETIKANLMKIVQKMTEKVPATFDDTSSDYEAMLGRKT